MSTETVKSGPITNRDATPLVFNNACVEHGFVREAVGTCEVTTGVTTGSKYILMQVPSNARPSALKIYSDDMGTGTAADFGLYQTTENGGAVVDADFFASGVDLAGGALTASDVLHEAGTSYDRDDAEKMIWQALGLSADPKISYDVVATTTATADVGGTLTAKMQYVV